MKIENIINHIVLVLDASASMSGVSNQLIKVADNQIEYLAVRSKELDRETRVTVYTFNTGNGYRSGSNIECLIYDKDVLRVPSIAGLYRTGGMTPLIDATMLALDDLAMTPEKYGEHSFLVYILTDGQENASRNRSSDLKYKIENLPEHWTLATFVPNLVAVHEAKKFGFPVQNIAVWDTTAKGIQEVGEKIRQTTENFMTARDHAKRTGTVFRGTRNLFSLENPSLTELQGSLTPLSRNLYWVFDVNDKDRIDEFVTRATGRPYKIGQAYYQLSKRETIQPQKEVAILSRKGNSVWTGPQARNLLGLPDDHVKVDPNYNDEYDIFVQSTSNNRNLMPNTRILVLK